MWSREGGKTLHWMNWKAARTTSGMWEHLSRRRETNKAQEKMKARLRKRLLEHHGYLGRKGRLNRILRGTRTRSLQNQLKRLCTQRNFGSLTVGAQTGTSEEREPHEVEVQILEKILQELSSHVEEQMAYRHIQTFVEKYSA